MSVLINQCKDMSSSLVRKWAFLCLAKIFKHIPSIMDELVNLEEWIHWMLYTSKQDESPQVRASVLYILEFFPPVAVSATPHFQNVVYELPPPLVSLAFYDAVLPLTLYLIHVCCQEMSPIVRRESAKLAVRTRKHLREQLVSNSEYDSGTIQVILEFLWEVLRYLSTDPQPEISALVQEILKDSNSCISDEHSQRGGAQHKKTLEHTDTASNISSLSSSPGWSF